MRRDERISVCATIDVAIEDLRRGRMIVVCGGENRENEGDLMIAAEHATPAAINFMATHGGGLICLALSAERCAEMRLSAMVAVDDVKGDTAFTVPIDARDGITSGISAADRAKTISVAIAPDAKPLDLVVPGHMFPLKARPYGVLEQARQTEAAVDLARLAGLNPSGVICAIMNDDGTLANGGDLIDFSRRHCLSMVTVSDLVAHRQIHEQSVEREVTTSLSSEYGEFRAVGYRSLLDDRQHIAVVKGRIDGQEDVLVRIHSACLTGDVFHSQRCDCDQRLRTALEMIEQTGQGVLLYLGQEVRGIGLLDRPKVYRTQEDVLGTDETKLTSLTVAVDARDYSVAAQVFRDLGLLSIRVITDDPEQIDGLQRAGAVVSDRIVVDHPRTAHYDACALKLNGLAMRPDSQSDRCQESAVRAPDATRLQTNGYSIRR